MDIRAVKQGTGEEWWKWEIQGGNSERQFGTAVSTVSCIWGWDKRESRI